jgi:DNA-binding response OmpR family regulator
MKLYHKNVFFKMVLCNIIYTVVFSETSAMRILLIEDEKDLVYFLKKILVNSGHVVDAYESYELFQQNDKGDHFDLLILDLMLQGMQGSDVVKDLRRKNNRMPVLILSAISKTPTKTELLNLGADDYLTKPFDVEELMARVKALSRRSLGTTYQDELLYSDLSFSPKEHTVTRGGKKVYLTEKEGKLLYELMQNPDKVVRTTDLLQMVWQASSGSQSNVVQATVRRLRKKVDSGFKIKLIHNIHGIGYSISSKQGTGEDFDD